MGAVADASAASAPAPSTSSQGESRSEPPRERDYSALYERIKRKPCRVANLEQLHETQGRKLRTRAHLIERELQKVQDASTLEEIHLALEEAGSNLEKLRVFSRIELLVNEEPEDEPEVCSVLVDLEEKNWYRAHLATYVQQQQQQQRGATGSRGPTQQQQQQQQQDRLALVLLRVVVVVVVQGGLAPLSPAPLPAGVLVGRWRRSLQRSLLNQQRTSSFTQTLHGLLPGREKVLQGRAEGRQAGVGGGGARGGGPGGEGQGGRARGGGARGSVCLSGVQALQAELGWRNLADRDPQPSASAPVQAQLGDFLKAALRYTLLWDRRSPGPSGAPESGWAVRCGSEVAGLPALGAWGAGAPAAAVERWAKQQLDVQVLLPLTRHLNLSLTASAGLLLPWGGEDALGRPTCIAERFFLGGPASLRGFSWRAVGPSAARRPRPSAGQGGGGGSRGGRGGAAAKRDSLGGDAFTSLLAAVSFPLPGRVLQALNLHGHLFINGGNCVDVSGSGRTFQASARRFVDTFRWSAGAGLVLPTWMGRFEANYVYVLASQEHDRVKQGLQLGFASSVFM
ncbi:hypothetical protein QJQ45_029911 [Haematococcus lacustris]|nr:hypothetical protein QJQ45_029911 [Haematococcus lacustris]